MTYFFCKSYNEVVLVCVQMSGLIIIIPYVGTFYVINRQCLFVLAVTQYSTIRSHVHTNYSEIHCLIRDSCLRPMDTFIPSRFLKFFLSSSSLCKCSAWCSTPRAIIKCTSSRPDAERWIPLTQCGSSIHCQPIWCLDYGIGLDYWYRLWTSWSRWPAMYNHSPVPLQRQMYVLHHHDMPECHR